VNIIESFPEVIYAYARHIDDNNTHWKMKSMVYHAMLIINDNNKQCKKCLFTTLSAVATSGIHSSKGFTDLKNVMLVEQSEGKEDIEPTNQ
jgi:hypothetical protein